MMSSLLPRLPSSPSRKLPVGGSRFSSTISAPPPPVVAVSAVIVDSTCENIVLIQRGKEPNKGYWSLPGGRVEPGETLVEAAIREVEEETLLTGLACPRKHPFTTAEVLFSKNGEPFDRTRHPLSELQFHYVIPEVLLVAGEPRPLPVASSDAAAARWVPISELDTISPLSDMVAEVAKMAVEVFHSLPVIEES
eukprot:TRINITY_DN4139_c0_g1_i1.p1 TRINITY_DN4139_c0_g1~~TRINITY_DN4139_c0_g1_i1.p1  ORF type:complete len:194 (-),score=46.59 TRINITY_DN4139_c0_g1_i1:112-693(-)